MYKYINTTRMNRKKKEKTRKKKKPEYCISFDVH